MDFTDQQIERYARHIVLKELGGAGQQRLLGARVLIVGAGGLGSPLALYLAAAGVGTLGIVDDDVVALSNLQRQILHRGKDIGRPKTERAAEAVAALNPDVTVRIHTLRLGAGNVGALIADYDVIADGSDNFATRYLLADAAYLGQKTLVSAAIGQFEGQLSTYRARADNDAPCYRCAFPEAPPAGSTRSCAEDGVIGALAGVMGSLQALEVIKEVTGIGESMAGRLLIYEARSCRFRTLRLKKDPACRLCGAKASIRDLSAHAA